MLMAFAILLGFQSCTGDDPKVTINTNSFDFKVVNLSVDDGKLTATGGTTVTVNWTVNVTSNGETTTASGTKKSNELPVMEGNEIEIIFSPLSPEQTEAYITMPDGKTHKVSLENPSFKWIVPVIFTDGLEITGECRYETKTTKYVETGLVKLISLIK